MKEIEKLAGECVEKRRQEIFDKESQPTDPDWFIPVYEAGFRKARGMAVDLAQKWDMLDKYPNDLCLVLENLGESEVE